MTSLSNTVLKIPVWAIGRIKPLLKRVIPRRVWSALKTVFRIPATQSIDEAVAIREWKNARKSAPWIAASSKLPGGVNLIGYLRAAKGISEAARSSLAALTAVQIPYTVNDFETGIAASMLVEALPKSSDGTGFKFNTNLIHINPPQLLGVWQAFKRTAMAGRYTIGVWYWELPALPEEWRFAFDVVDEVWVGSQFIFESVSARSPVPVTKIPPCIQPVYDARYGRSSYGLPDDRFLFLCAYDVLSIQARKNPLGAMEAFKRAFRGGDTSVGLVVKINNALANPEEVQFLRNQLAGYSNCYFIEEVMDRPRINSLINVVDAYISLHRSEGFGLVPAEAMSFGKPVIMTRWSGNVDLMTGDNSCGVDYRLVPVGENAGPYASSQLWADPDIDHAAFFMRKLHADQQYYAGISEHARKFISVHFSPGAIGRRIRERMQQIALL